MSSFVMHIYSQGNKQVVAVVSNICLKLLLPSFVSHLHASRHEIYHITKISNTPVPGYASEKGQTGVKCMILES